MTTEITTKDGRVVAFRFYGGKARGALVQMEIAEFEYQDWKDQEVQEGKDGRFVRLDEWLHAQNASVIWDNAARQNALARDLETCRFAHLDSARKAAAMTRIRARYLARKSLRASLVTSEQEDARSGFDTCRNPLSVA